MLCTDASRLMDSAETRGGEKWKMVMLTKNVSNWVAHSNRIWADCEKVRKWNMERAGEVLEKVAQAVLECAPLKAVKEKLASFKLKLVISRVESANFLWSAHSVTMDASTVEDDVSNGLMAVPGDSTYATKQKLFIFEMELRIALRRV